MRNTLNWFEIFVADLDRAAAFYEAMLHTTLPREDFGGEPHALFADDGQTGALVVRKDRAPGADGVLIYLNCDGTLDACLARVEAAGGKVLVPKTDIGAPGYIGVVVDTEGNAIGLHSNRNNRAASDAYQPA